MNDFLNQVQPQNQVGIPLWMWGLVVVIVIIVAIVWVLREEEGAVDRKADSATQKPQTPTPAPTVAKAVVAEDTATAPVEQAARPVVEVTHEETPKPQPKTRPDNLKRVKGIGPKIEKLLKDNDINTFTQLAETEVSRLQALLDEAEYALADPATWPEQARQLAADKS